MVSDGRVQVTRVSLEQRRRRRAALAPGFPHPLGVLAEAARFRRRPVNLCLQKGEMCLWWPCVAVQLLAARLDPPLRHRQALVIHPALGAVRGGHVNTARPAVVRPGFPVVYELRLAPRQGFELGVAVLHHDVHVRVARVVMAHQGVVAIGELIGAEGAGRPQHGVTVCARRRGQDQMHGIHAVRARRERRAPAVEQGGDVGFVEQVFLRPGRFQRQRTAAADVLQGVGDAADAGELAEDLEHRLWGALGGGERAAKGLRCPGRCTGAVAVTGVNGIG